MRRMRSRQRTFAGVIQNDPFDGLTRAVVDGLACLAGFAVLGRFLGMRR